MAKENKSINKWIFFAFGLLFGLILIYGLYFMTMYANVHVMYLITEDGTIEITSESSQSVGGTDPTNAAIWSFFTNARNKIVWWNGIFGSDGGSTATTLARKIYNFQINASSFNDLIIIYSIVGLIAFAGLLIFANHSRKVYYVSNLAAGISIPVLMIVFSGLMLFKNITLMADFNSNKELYTIANYFMNTDIQTNVKDKLVENTELTKDQFISSMTKCDSTSFILGIVLYVAVMAFSVFIIVITLRKYKATAKKRAEVIQRAVLKND